MKSYFRLYAGNKAEFNSSSIFDLITGDKETKQTKGLAYIFSQYDDFLLKFLKFKPIENEINKLIKTNLKVGNINAIEISAERISNEKKRADIVIKIDTNKKPLIVLMIEAKSIKVNDNQQILAKQIQSYLDPHQFPDLRSYLKVGIVLTKYQRTIPTVVNIVWEDIIQLLDDCKKKSNDDIIAQYKNFLTGVDKSMKYYEREVLSIPAGKSLDRVERYKVYSCPNTKYYNYKKSLFVTFRKGNGGIMERLYKIEAEIIMNPTRESERQVFDNSTYSDNIKKRVFDYIINAEYPNSIDNDERYYVLSETETIELKHQPKPKRNNAKFTYYTLSEILSNKIVKPESQNIM